MISFTPKYGHRFPLAEKVFHKARRFFTGYKDPEVDWRRVYNCFEGSLYRDNVPCYETCDSADCNSRVHPGRNSACCSFMCSVKDTLSVPLFAGEQEFRDSEEFPDISGGCPFNTECYGVYRPFFCRTFPFFPIVEPSGRIVGAVQSKYGCYTFSGEGVNMGSTKMVMDSSWFLGWIQAWPEVLRHKGNRVLATQLALNILAEEACEYTYVFDHGFLFDTGEDRSFEIMELYKNFLERYKDIEGSQFFHPLFGLDR